MAKTPVSAIRLTREVREVLDAYGAWLQYHHGTAPSRRATLEWLLRHCEVPMTSDPPAKALRRALRRFRDG